MCLQHNCEFLMETWDERVAQAPLGLRLVLISLRRITSKHRLRHTKAFQNQLEPMGDAYVEFAQAVRGLLKVSMRLNRVFMNAPGPLVAVSSENYWRSFKRIHDGWVAGEFHLLPSSQKIEASGMELLGDIKTALMDSREPFALCDPHSGHRLVPVSYTINACQMDPRFVMGVCWSCGTLTASFNATPCGSHVVCDNEACRSQSADECRRVAESIADAIATLRKDKNNWPFCQVSFKSTEDGRRLSVPVPRNSVIHRDVPMACTLFQGLSEEQAKHSCHQLPRFGRELLKAELTTAVSCEPCGNRNRRKRH
jgi:hypothetical protein